jgi:hypothetical protein
MIDRLIIIEAPGTQSIDGLSYSFERKRSSAATGALNAIGYSVPSKFSKLPPAIPTST